MTPRARETLRRIEAFAAANFRETITVADVSRTLSLNRSHVARLYKIARGRSLTAHLTELRIRHAQTLLALGAATVADAAFASGFGSMSRFYEAFRKITGHAPTDEPQPAPHAPLGIVHALWVDDEPLHNIVERRQLANLGVLTDSYTNNSDGLRALDHGGYSLVISDITRARPGDSGWLLARSIRRRDPRIPFFFYVGRDDPRRRRLARQLGVNGIFVRSEALIRAITAQLDSREGGRAKS